MYDSTVANGGLYPFSEAISAYTAAGNFANIEARQTFVPYSINRKTGNIIASFWNSEVGNPNIAPSSANPNNLPIVPTVLNGSAGIAYTPSTGIEVGVKAFVNWYRGYYGI